MHNYDSFLAMRTFKLYFLNNFSKIFVYCCSVIVVAPFPPLLAPSPSPTPTVNPPTVHVHESFIHVPLLACSPYFPCYPLSPSPMVVNNFQICNTMLLTIVTMLYSTSLGLIYLITGILYLLTTFTFFIFHLIFSSLFYFILHLSFILNKRVLHILRNTMKFLNHRRALVEDG